MSNTIDYQLIGKRVRAFRKNANLTQTQLADILNYTPGYISQIERGLTRPNLDTLSIICTALNCDVAALIRQTNKIADYMMPDFQVLLEKLTPQERKRWYAMLAAYIEQRDKEI